MSETPTEQNATPASRTITGLMEAMETRPSPAFTQIVRLIQDITSRADTISIKELAEVIGADLSTMTRVLGVANTMGYNPTGAEITTIQQAVQTIGFEKIRNIALTILLLESAERGSNGAVCRQVAGQALGSATLAAVLTEETKGSDPEQVFVCAALRSYGDLVLAHYLPDLYKRANDPTVTGPRDSRYRAAFGLTSLEVAREILTRLQLPKPLLVTLRPTPPEAIQSKRPSAADRVMLTLDFATRFCEQLSQAKSDAGSPAAQAERFAKQYGNHFAWDEEAFERVFEKVRERFASSGQAQGIRGFSTPLIQLLASEKGTTASTERSPAPSAAGKPKNPQSEEGLDGLLNKFNGRTLGPQDLAEVLAEMLPMLHHELRLEQSVVFLRDDFLPMWSARVGEGPLFLSIRSQPLLTLDTKNAFTICLSRGEDVLIQNPEEPSIRRYIPEWLLPHIAKRSLLLLSLRDATGTYGVICALGDAQQSVSLTNRLARPLQDLRAFLSRVTQTNAAA